MQLPGLRQNLGSGQGRGVRECWVVYIAPGVSFIWLHILCTCQDSCSEG